LKLRKRRTFARENNPEDKTRFIIELLQSIFPSILVKIPIQTANNPTISSRIPE